MDANGRTKKACQRCRSLKARCPGPLGPETSRCARCIKAGDGAECVYVEHRRGRKVGTRLSDPTKALMRMKSALTVLQNAGELEGLEQLSEALLAKAARASSSAASGSSGGGQGQGEQAVKGKQNSGRTQANPGKGKGKGRASVTPALSDLPSDDDEGEPSSDDARSLDANNPRPGDDGQTINGFANDDLYSHASLSATESFPPGPPSASSSLPHGSHLSLSSSTSADGSHPLPTHVYADPTPPLSLPPQQAAYPPRSAYGSLHPSSALHEGTFPPPFPTPFHPTTTTTTTRARGSSAESTAIHQHQQQQALGSGGHAGPSTTTTTKASGPRSPHFTPTPPPPPPPSTSTMVPSQHPNQFDDLIPLRSSSKSLSTLFRPRGVPSLSSPSSFSSYPANATSNEGASAAEGWRKDVVSRGLVSEGEARRLFAFFMDKIGGMVYLFDPVLQTHDAVRRSSSLLYATILAIALRFSNAPEEQYRRVLASARDGVLGVLADNVRSEEAIQALLLMTEYKGIDDEGSYLMLGMAIRIGMDVDLGKPLAHLDERQNRSRQRCWLGLFNADRRFGGCGQIQKPEIMPEDAVIRASVSFHDHPLRLPGDTRLIAGTQLRRLISRYSDLIQTDAGELAPQLNMREVYRGASDELDAWSTFWEGEIERLGARDGASIEVAKLQSKLMIAHHWIYRACRYPRSPWIHSPEEWETERRAALAACLGLSVGILNQMVKMPQDAMRYSPDSTHLFYAYGTFMLEKLFRARLLETHVLDPASTQLIFDVIRASADKLDSVTLSAGSATALHANLLRSLLPDGHLGEGSNGSRASSATLSSVGAVVGGFSAAGDQPRQVGGSIEESQQQQSTTPALVNQQQQQQQPWVPAPSPTAPGFSAGLADDDLGFGAFDAGGGWVGLDDEALEALATMESTLGTFNWDELTYSPP